MREYTQQILTLASVIKAAALAGALKKAVLSKCLDQSVVRITLSARTIGGKLCLQAESLHTDNKAKHKNLEMDDTDALLALLAYA